MNELTGTYRQSPQLRQHKRSHSFPVNFETHGLLHGQSRSLEVHCLGCILTNQTHQAPTITDGSFVLILDNSGTSF